MKNTAVLLLCFAGACLMVAGLPPLFDSMGYVGAGLGLLVIALIVQGVGNGPRPNHPLHRNRLRGGMKGEPW